MLRLPPSSRSTSNLVATAGHCVYDTDTNKPVQTTSCSSPATTRARLPGASTSAPRSHTHYDFDVYEDYDNDYAFVNVYNGIKQQPARRRSTTRPEYDKDKGGKYAVDVRDHGRRVRQGRRQVRPQTVRSGSLAAKVENVSSDAEVGPQYKGALASPPRRTSGPGRRSPARSTA